MPVTINGTNGVTTPEVVLDNSAADGAQVVLKSSGYSDWNLDNYSGRLRAYYGSTEYWTVDASGNVGIGTSSPAAKLDVATTTGFTFNTTSSAGVRFGTQGTTGGSFMVQTQSANASYGSGLAIDGTYSSGTLQSTVNIKAFGVYSGGGYGSSLAFHTSSGTTLSERARIDSSGNLLVGTTSTLGGRLNVLTSGAGGFPVVTRGTDRGVYVDLTATSGIAAYFTTSSGAVQAGLISVSTNTAAYTSGSDYRLKDNVRPLTNALDKVAALRPVAFEWKADGTSGESFIAHELAEVCPQAVVGEKDAVDADGKPVYQGIDTSFLIATLTAAIQEQQAIITALTARVTALDTRLTSLEGTQP